MPKSPQKRQLLARNHATWREGDIGAPANSCHATARATTSSLVSRAKQLAARAPARKLRTKHRSIPHPPNTTSHACRPSSIAPHFANASSKSSPSHTLTPTTPLPSPHTLHTSPHPLTNTITPPNNTRLSGLTTPNQPPPHPNQPHLYPNLIPPYHPNSHTTITSLILHNPSHYTQTPHSISILTHFSHNHARLHNAHCSSLTRR